MSIVDIIDGKSTDRTLDVDWEWNCTEEVRQQLSDLGLYDSMKECLYVINTSHFKTDIDKANKRLDGLNKALTIMKNTITVTNNTSESDESTGVGKIVIDMKRDE